MFFRIKKSGDRAYLQVVENHRNGSAVRQSVIANLYPAHPTTRKSPGSMTRKLSVTESHSCGQFRGTSSRRKLSVVPAKSLKLA
jgi:hypothetical protein